MKFDKTLYEDRNLSLESGEDGIYRITFFEKRKWRGDLVFSKEGIIANEL